MSLVLDGGLALATRDVDLASRTTSDHVRSLKLCHSTFPSFFKA